MWDTWAQSKSKSEPNSKLPFTYLWQPLSTYPTVPLRHISSNVFFFFLESIMCKQAPTSSLSSLKPSEYLEGFAPRYCWRGAVYFIFLAGTYGYVSRSLSWALSGNDRRQVSLGYPNSFFSIQLLVTWKLSLWRDRLFSVSGLIF